LTTAEPTTPILLESNFLHLPPNQLTPPLFSQSSRIFVTHADAMEKKAKELLRGVKSISIPKEEAWTPEKQERSKSKSPSVPAATTTPPSNSKKKIKREEEPSDVGDEAEESSESGSMEPGGTRAEWIRELLQRSSVAFPERQPLQRTTETMSAFLNAPLNGEWRQQKREQIRLTCSFFFFFPFLFLPFLSALTRCVVRRGAGLP
jgi:hypothetical protein